MALTDVKVRTTKSQEKAFKLADEKGLSLYVTPKGSRYWRMKYRFGGKEKLLALGIYPDVSLAKAREKRDEARKLLADNIDPGEHRKIMKKVDGDRLTNSFEIVTREWFVKHATNWVKSHGDKIIQRFERDIFPWIGNKPISEVTPPTLLEVIRRIEERGALETAHRALSNCGQVFRYAIATGRTDRDPSQDLKGALPPVKTKHFAAQTDPKRFGELLKVFDTYEGSLIVRCALRLAPLIFVRPGELRHAKWEDIDLETAQWSYIVSKTDTPHIVPLTTQAVAILKELHPLTGDDTFVFPSARSNSRPMSDNAILAALRRLGISKEEATGHGFRALARTLLDEVLNVRPDIIEHQLAHAVRGPNGRAYNRTAHLIERRKMMQDWADYLHMPDLSTLEGQDVIRPYTDKADLIIIDNISTLGGCSKENEAQSWFPLQQLALELRRQGKSVLFIHHAGKSGTQRGTSKREDILDTSILLKHPSDYEPSSGACFEVHFEKARGMVGESVNPLYCWLTDDGWKSEALEDSNCHRVIELSNEGLKQTEIAVELDLSRGYVSKLLKRGKALGEMKPK